jgi:hypothetical protein
MHARPIPRLVAVFGRGRVHAFLCALMFLCAGADAAEHAWAISSLEHRLEHEIKAAFLYQFGAYVDWPEGTFDDGRTPLLIGVFDDEAIAALLTDIVRQRTVHGRPLRVLRIDADDDPSGLHVLFIGSPPRSEGTRTLLERVRGRPVLTVIDDDPLAAGIIRFVIEQDRVRFDVSLDRANESGLRISSRLLGVARRVEEGGR